MTAVLENEQISPTCEAFLNTVAVLYRVLPLLAFHPVHCPPAVCSTLLLAVPLRPESTRDTAVSPGPFVFCIPNLNSHLNHKSSHSKVIPSAFFGIGSDGRCVYDGRGLAPCLPFWSL